MTAQEALRILNANQSGVVYTPEEAELILKESLKLAEIYFPRIKEMIAGHAEQSTQ